MLTYTNNYTNTAIPLAAQAILSHDSSREFGAPLLNIGGQNDGKSIAAHPRVLVYVLVGVRMTKTCPNCCLT
jgi:hypothetical protein